MTTSLAAALAVPRRSMLADLEHRLTEPIGSSMDRAPRALRGRGAREDPGSDEISPDEISPAAAARDLR